MTIKATATDSGSMPTSKTDKTRPPIPGLKEITATGRGVMITPSNAHSTQNPPLYSSRKEPRRIKVHEDVDPDYAEEAEDFFYGEGM